MSISPLVPALGAAGLFAARAVQGLAGGGSFADVFRRADAAQPPAREAEPEAPRDPAPSEPAPGGVSSRQMLEDFRDQVLRRLAAAGIDLSEPIDLSAVGRDGVKVSGRHSEWSKVERLFDEDPSLREAFHRLSETLAAERGEHGRRLRIVLQGNSVSADFE